MTDPTGRKNDNGKHRYDLVPVGALRAIVEVLTFGAGKYDDDNWRRVPDAKRRYTAALMRHVEAWRGGEVNDPETGAHHLAHAACCAMFLIEVEGADKATNRMCDLCRTALRESGATWCAPCRLLAQERAK